MRQSKYEYAAYLNDEFDTLIAYGTSEELSQRWGIRKRRFSDIVNESRAGKSPLTFVILYDGEVKETTHGNKAGKTLCRTWRYVADGKPLGQAREIARKEEAERIWREKREHEKESRKESKQ